MRAEQITRQYYDAEAFRYDRTHGAGQYGAQYGIRTYYRPFWRKYIRKSDGILEIGCGTGVFTSELRKLCRSITAVELSPKMAAEARRRNVGVDIRIGSAHRLPFPAQRFDAVACINSFSYIVDQQQALREIARVLKPNGVLLIIDMNFRCPAYWIMYLTRHRRLKHFFHRLIQSNPEQLQALLQENGFRVLHCAGGNFVPHGVGTLRARSFFIPLDRALGSHSFTQKFGMRIFCASQRPHTAQKSAQSNVYSFKYPPKGQ